MNNPNSHDAFEERMRQAARHEPDTAAAELGFETQLLARIRELRESGGGGGSVFEVFAEWSWRSAFGLTPLVAAAAIFYFGAYGLSPSLPSGTEDLVGYLSSWLPG